MSRKTIAFIAAFLFILSTITGCTISDDLVADSTPASAVNQTPATSISLAFDGAMSLDPYVATSALNIQIGKLCWEPLFALDNQMNCLPVIAKGFQKISDTSYLVTLNPAKKFWDGSSVTADDVIFSYTKAVSGVNFAPILKSISSVSKSGNNLVVTLTRPDIYFYGCLDFPIIKNETYQSPPKNTDGQSPYAVTPVFYAGTGIYIPNFSGNVATLKLNTAYPGQKACVKTITLKSVPDFDSMNSAISEQLLGAGYSDLLGGKKPSVSGNTLPVSQNVMVYLGFVQNGQLADVRLRTAISLGLNRTMIDSYFSGYAITASTPFHPNFFAAASKQCTNFVYNPNQAKTTLAAVGTLSPLKLIYCSDNTASTNVTAEIVLELKQSGITVIATGLPLAGYRSAVAGSACDMYIGQMLLSNDCSMQSLLDPAAASLYVHQQITSPSALSIASSSQSASVTSSVTTSSVSSTQSGTTGLPITTGEPKFKSPLGISCTPSLRGTLDDFLAGGSIDSFINTFNTELPYLPLLYCNAMTASAKEYTIPQTTVFNTAFSGISTTTITPPTVSQKTGS